MPTYEYACTQCGQHIEVFQRIADASLTTCGACGGALRKVFHPAGIMFKGSGFYSTDNRSKSKTSKESGPSGGSSKSDSPSDSDSGAKGESKSEGAPKPASETKSTPAKEKSA